MNSLLTVNRADPESDKSAISAVSHNPFEGTVLFVVCLFRPLSSWQFHHSFLLVSLFSFLQTSDLKMQEARDKRQEARGKEEETHGNKRSVW